MKRTSLILLAIGMLALASCKFSPKSEEKVSNIDGELQDSVSVILERHLVEYDAMDGVAIVIETNSGRIRAMVGLEAKGKAVYERADSLAGNKHCSALMRTVSVLAALNTGKVKSDTKVDTGDGVYVCEKDTVYDHNWRRGGYGELTLRQALALCSDIGTVKAIDKAFTDKKQFLESVKKMSFGLPLEVEGIRIDSCSQKSSELPWYDYALGYKETSPIQMLAFYNAIANNGRMMAPLLYKPSNSAEDEGLAINRQIASPASITAIQEMFVETMSKGLGKRAVSGKVDVVGMCGTIQNNDHTLTADFCGYFPAKDPIYTVIVSVHRKEQPAAGGVMAGTILKEIAENLSEKGAFRP